MARGRRWSRSTGHCDECRVTRTRWTAVDARYQFQNADTTHRPRGMGCGSASKRYRSRRFCCQADRQYRQTEDNPDARKASRLGACQLPQQRWPDGERGWPRYTSEHPDHLARFTRCWICGGPATPRCRRFDALLSARHDKPEPARNWPNA